MAKPFYTYGTREMMGRKFLLIVDHGGPHNMTVTNCIEDVVREIREEEPDLGEVNILYKDSQGIWDGYSDKEGIIVLFGNTPEEAAELYIMKENKVF